MAEQNMSNYQRIDELEVQNQRLKEHLSEYKALEEDLLSQKVYEKARKLMVGWISIAGIGLTIFGITGMNSIQQQAKERVEKSTEGIAQATIKKVQEQIKTAVSDAEIKQIFDAEIERQVSELAKSQDREISALRNEIGSIRSEQGKNETSIEFVNSLQESVNVFWVDYNGKEIKYATLDPGKRFLQPTYITHPWIVRRTSDKRKVGFIVGKKEKQTLNIKLEGRNI